MATLTTTTTTTTERSCSRAGLRTRTLVHCFHPRARSVPGTAQKVTRLVAPATLRGRPLFDIAILVPVSLSLSLIRSSSVSGVVFQHISLFSSITSSKYYNSPPSPIHRQVEELFFCTLHARWDGSKLAAMSRLVSIIIIANHTIASSNHHDPHPAAIIIIIIGHSGQLGKKGHCIIDGAKNMPVVLGAIVSTVRLVSSRPVCVCVHAASLRKFRSQQRACCTRSRSSGQWVLYGQW